MLPVLVWAFGVRDAIPILTLAELMGNISRVWLNRREISLPVAGWFALGAVPSAILGGIVFATAPAPALTRIVGLFLVLVVAYRHSPWGRQAHLGIRSFLPLGGTAGFVSAIAGSTGPFIAPFFLAYGLVKGAYIGTQTLATLTMHITKIAVYGRYALLTSQSLAAGLTIGAVMFLGSYVGRNLLNRISERAFIYLVEGVLVASGLLFLIRG